MSLNIIVNCLCIVSFTISFISIENDVTFHVIQFLWVFKFPGKLRLFKKLRPLPMNFYLFKITPQGMIATDCHTTDDNYTNVVTKFKGPTDWTG